MQARLLRLHPPPMLSCAQVTVTLPNGKDTRDYVGRIIGSDGDKDVAVLAIDVPPEDRQLLQPLPVGRSAGEMRAWGLFACT